jgi:hypothetical protein
LDSNFSTAYGSINDANTYSNYGADTGVANAYVVTLTGVTTTYTAGLRIQFKASNANTGASTLNVNGGGVKNITFQDGTALISGAIVLNSIVDVMYDGTQFLLMNVTGKLPITNGGTALSSTPSNGQLLIGNGTNYTLANITVSAPLSITNGAGSIALSASGIGSGDVIGSASSTDNALVRFDGTTGKIIQNSTATLSDAGALALVGTANTLTLSGSSTGNPATIAATGTDTNIELRLTGKGVLGGVSLGTADGTSLFAYTFGAPTVNYFQVVGSPTGSSPLFYVAGSDSNVSMYFGTQGTGVFDFATNSTDRQFRIAHTANTLNYLEVTGGDASNARVKINAQGSDTNVGIQYSTKNSGFHNFIANGGEQFRIFSVASAVNYLQANGGAAGNGVRLTAGGSDTDIDINITPKGAGNVSFGTYTGSVLAIAGYIEIKDSSGNIRKLAVVA